MAKMIMTSLEAEVKAENWKVLEDAFSKAVVEIPGSIYETFLIQDLDDPSNWRILTVWRSREDLDKMRQSGETPTGVVIFRTAQAQPTLTIFDIAAHGIGKL